MRTRVKICGITRPEDGLAAARLGADAIGLVFHSPSLRAVSEKQARAICEALPPFVTRVGLFVNAERGKIERILAEVALDLLQFHGDEPAADCEGYGRPWIKALRMAPGLDVIDRARQYRAASGILLDSYQAGQAGGTGTTFDWSRVPAALDTPLILAGGLEPGNVAAAIEQVQPWAVDVSGGVEASKGIKSAARMAAFMHEVNHVEAGRAVD
jgi:phosphoribosylanthranilate isomerase